ncbi:hypothetical protein [Clostridium lacusfryxellense]|uniref:hypothetical protein n=1 Tax=Clostridium lacusfryxellense TaxID=205328 RepID=UPI001C0B01B6|nr:hypothetical protein [Clostridium lacusfryxellense]MBU3112021.1 hypothetical protein [Clostridium lacusfryxellense]
MNNITSLVEGIKGAGADGWDSLKTIAKFLNYLMHPSLIVSALWNYTQAYAFWICLLLAMLAAIFYGLGFKKCAKWIPGSIAIFTLIKTIGGAF